LVLTGYNTDVDHKGTTYHVQTEDKGRSNPFVESLVYTAGQILYSRRTPYQDLIDQNVDLKAVASLMERQHRTIVEAIRRGRLAQLTGDTEAEPEDDTSVAKGETQPPPSADTTKEPDRSLDQVILDYLEAQRAKAHLVLRAAGESDFVYGETARLRVVAVDSQDNNPQEGVRVAVLFKSTAEPRRLLLAEGETDDTGVFTVETQLPPFNGGTSAVVITAHSGLGQSEIKHLVHR
jgi:hypothetical protein